MVVEHHGMRNWPSIPSIALQREVTKSRETWWKKPSTGAGSQLSTVPICDLVISKTPWKRKEFTVNGPFVLLAASISSNPWPQGFGSSHKHLLDLLFPWDGHTKYFRMAMVPIVDSVPQNDASWSKPKGLQLTLRQVIHWFTVSSLTCLNPLKLFLEGVFGSFFCNSSSFPIFLNSTKPTASITSQTIQHQNFHTMSASISSSICKGSTTSVGKLSCWAAHERIPYNNSSSCQSMRH